MKRIIRQIPNTLTCANLACGFIASIQAMQGEFTAAMRAIFIAAAFDFADGMAARLLKAYSPLGKELDSLADLVSFGVAPGLMLYAFFNQLGGLAAGESCDPNYGCHPLVIFIPTLAVPVLSALRLARFNLDDRQKTSFIGLPVPAHAILLSSLIVSFNCPTCSRALSVIADIDKNVIYIGMAAFATLSSLLLVSGVRLLSLKFTSLSWKGNQARYILIASAVALTVAFGSAGVAATILLYLLMPVKRN